MTLKSSTQTTDLKIGNNIARIRKTLGMSQTDLAEALGVTFQQVQKYENGRNRVSVSALLIICQKLGVTPMDIIGEQFGSAVASPVEKLASELVDLKRRLSDIRTLAA